MRTVPATLVLLAAGCAQPPIPPERAERDRAIMSAIEPCKRQYPSMRDVEVDEHGMMWAETRSNSRLEWDGFKLCVQKALKTAAVSKPFGAGRLASTAAPATVAIEPAGTLGLVPALVNGAAATLLLDTGASLTIIRPALAKRAGIELAPGAPKILGAVVGGQRVSIPFVRVRSVSVGAASVEGIDVGVFEALPHAPDVDGILGGNFLNHFKVTIDRQGRRVTLEPSRTASAQ